MRVSSHGKWYWRPSYLGYSVACMVAWAVIWILLATLASPPTVHRVGYVFLGWVIGWVSASIARVVYPAPRSTLLTRDRHR
jgi:purine-cytosine permease-like protein